MGNVQPVPEGMKGVIAHLTVRDCARAIDWYKQVFGATELGRHAMPDGKIMHATITIAGAPVMLNDEFPDMKCLSPQSLGGTSVYLMHYVDDVDKVFQRAVDAGAETRMPVADQFWGDRYGMLQDPFGHYWEIATHKEDLSPDEMERRGREAMAQMSQK